MFEQWKVFFSTENFMPHGHCYLWSPSLVWLQVLSNGLIGFSYMAISLTLAYLVYRIRDIPFQRMYLAFGIFIVSCGVTHFFDIWTIWTPDYWVDGMVRALTAVASVGTAAILPAVVPKAVLLAKGAKAAHDKGIRLESAYAQLGQLDELKTNFFANVSHELRTPLTLILGPADRMRSAENLTSEQRRDLEVIGRNAQLLLKHVNDLLDVAKLEAKKTTPVYARIDLSRLIRTITGNFDGLARERGVRLQLDLPATLELEADPDMIGRVLLNLLSNAFKYVPIQGRVRVSAQAWGSEVTIEVEDDGPGVPENLREVIFERFHQGDSSASRSHEGTGLGLSIAKEFAELHRGRIAVDTGDMGGARFKFKLPLHAPTGAEVSTSAPVGELQEAHERAQSLVAAQTVETLREADRNDAAQLGAQKDRGTILVVEDNVDMNRFIAETLSVEYNIHQAYNGREGLEKAVSSQPDLVLSDVMMPELSGDQMVTEMRKIEALASIPIVVLTAKADDDLKNSLLRDGAQDCLVKPFSPEELKARVRNLVSMKRARDALQREFSTQLQDLAQLASEVGQKKRELQALAESLRIAKEEAEKASQAKSAFLSLMSHEMKTPMTSLKLQLQLLKRTESDQWSEHQRELIARLERSSQQSVQLMDTLLEFTRIQSGKIEPRVSAIQVSAMAWDLVETYRPEAQEKSLELKLDADETMPPLKSDATLVQIVLGNLLTNAIKYTDQGSIKVSLAYRDGMHCIEVKDTGPGIAEEDKSVIFEPFTQLAPLEKKSKPGVGLGLAIATETIRALGGRIELYSKPGHGSAFVACFPSLA